MWNLKILVLIKKENKTNKQNETKNEEMERTEQISGSQWGRGLGVGKMVKKLTVH